MINPAMVEMTMVNPFDNWLSRHEIPVQPKMVKKATRFLNVKNWNPTPPSSASKEVASASMSLSISPPIKVMMRITISNAEPINAVIQYTFSNGR